ncbi:MAG TPA: hypothetical protein VKI40_01485, partial [Terriglobales bacterium]|nr:hypothetical protein [Terriglobales bacterium]
NDSEDSYAGSAASWHKNNSNRKMQTIPYPVYYVLVVNDGEILAGHYCLLNRFRARRFHEYAGHGKTGPAPNGNLARAGAADAIRRL